MHISVTHSHNDMGTAAEIGFWDYSRHEIDDIIHFRAVKEFILIGVTDMSKKNNLISIFRILFTYLIIFFISAVITSRWINGGFLADFILLWTFSLLFPVIFFTPHTIQDLIDTNPVLLIHLTESKKSDPIT